MYTNDLQYNRTLNYRNEGGGRSKNNLLIYVSLHINLNNTRCCCSFTVDIMCNLLSRKWASKHSVETATIYDLLIVGNLRTPTITSKPRVRQNSWSKSNTAAKIWHLTHAARVCPNLFDSLCACVCVHACVRARVPIYSTVVYFFLLELYCLQLVIREL